jgi:hypothetical protein
MKKKVKCASFNNIEILCDDEESFDKERLLPIIYQAVEKKLLTL